MSSNHTEEINERRKGKYWPICPKCKERECAHIKPHGFEFDICCICRESMNAFDVCMECFPLVWWERIRETGIFHSKVSKEYLDAVKKIAELDAKERKKMKDPAMILKNFLRQHPLFTDILFFCEIIFVIYMIFLTIGWC